MNEESAKFLVSDAAEFRKKTSASNSHHDVNLSLKTLVVYFESNIREGINYIT